MMKVPVWIKIVAQLQPRCKNYIYIYFSNVLIQQSSLDPSNPEERCYVETLVIIKMYIFLHRVYECQTNRHNRDYFIGALVLIKISHVKHIQHLSESFESIRVFALLIYLQAAVQMFVAICHTVNRTGYCLIIPVPLPVPVPLKSY